MGFLDWVFKREKKEEEPKEVNKQDLPSVEKILKEKMAEGQKAIEPELRNYHKKLLEMNEQLRNSLEALDSAVPKEKMDEKLLFAAQTGRPTFRNKISKVSEAIKKSVDFDFHSFSEYYNGCVFAVNQANALAITEFRFIGIVFKREGHAVGDNVRRLKEYLSDIGNRIKQHQQMANPYEEVLENISEMRTMLDKLAVDKMREYETRNEIEERQKQEEETRKSVEELLSSGEWKGYERELERKKEMKRKESGLKVRFNETIYSLERPMKKAKKIIDEDQESTEPKKVFEDYLRNPFETFLKDDNEQALKEFLSKTKKFLEEKKIDVNENVREKSIGKIDELISKNYLKEWKEEYESVIKETNDEESQLPIKKSELEKKLREIGAVISEDRKRIETVGKQIEQERKLIEDKRKEVDGKLKEFGHHSELEVNY